MDSIWKPLISIYEKIDKNNGQQIAAQQSAEKFINQFNLAMKAIDSLNKL